jgi:hypothetical protein
MGLRGRDLCKDAHKAQSFSFLKRTEFLLYCALYIYRRAEMGRGGRKDVRKQSLLV